MLENNKVNKFYEYYTFNDESRSMLLSDLHETVDKCDSSEILWSMEDDEISKVACDDWLIKQLYEKHGSSQKKGISHIGGVVSVDHVCGLFSGLTFSSGWVTGL